MDIRRIEARDEDSVHLVVEGSLEKLQRIEQLFKSGQLKEILGITVDDVQLTLPVKEAAVVPNEARVNLSQWLENVVDDTWKTVREILDRERFELMFESRSANPNIVILAETIVSGTPPIAHPLALVVATIQKPDRERDICLQIHPIGSKYLPCGLDFMAIDPTSGETIVQDRSADNREWIQLNINGRSGEEFRVQVALDYLNFTQDFVI